MEKQIRCILLDDETPALNLLRELLSAYPEIELAGSFKNTESALAFMQQAEPIDLIFTDIHMPGQRGTDFARNLPEDILIVFTTAYSEYASHAFDLDAMDYLIKPFSAERFRKTILKARENLRLKELSRTISRMQEFESEHLVIRSNHKLIKIPYQEILFIEAFQEYVKIITPDQRYITFERMKNMENLLPAERFMRVHRSYIAAVDKVNSLSGNLLQIRDNVIPISRDLKEQVIRRMF